MRMKIDDDEDYDLTSPNVRICRTVSTDQHPDDHKTPPRRRAHNAECQDLLNCCHRSTPQERNDALENLICLNVLEILDMNVSKLRFWKGRNTVCANTLWDQKNGAPAPRF